MAKRFVRSGSARRQGLWPLLLLILVVVIPTVCVLWFMTEAMRNERLAVRQKLMVVYEDQLAGATQQLQTYLDGKKATLASVDAESTAAEIFTDLVRAKVADSVIVYDAAGMILYPTSTKPASGIPTSVSPLWQQARKLEFEKIDYDGANKAYAEIARESSDINIAARALQAQVRCLFKSGGQETAIRHLVDELDKDIYRDVVDAQGRLITPNAQLLVLQLMHETDEVGFRHIFQVLKLRLVNYTDSPFSSDQRRFLMQRLQSLRPDAVEFPTLAAEQLAVRYLESNPPHPQDSLLRVSELPDIWQLASPDRRVLALFMYSELVNDMQNAIARSDLSSDIYVEFVQPGAIPSPSSLLVSPAGRTGLDGWRLSLHFRDVGDENLLDDAAVEQIAAYLWTGILVIAVIVIIAIVGAGAIRQQVRLATLKSDLVDTVSHELKTPLSSIRLLVDTLMDDKRFDERKVRDYLHLIAKENARLSHLIDNFLTFSRMQRNKLSFTLTESDASEIVNAAVDAVGQKFNLAQCRLNAEIAPGLPKILADTNALVTVVTNLLDNAYKYTEDDKRITLRTYANGEYVYFEVQDNGIGLSHLAAKRVFERFYQEDQRLSRSGSGCGLGLSIVQFIVTAHGGSVSVDSEPGRGSTFMFRIPIAIPESERTVGASG